VRVALFNAPLVSAGCNRGVGHQMAPGLADGRHRPALSRCRQLATMKDEKELRFFLDRALKEELPGKESRAKSVGIVLRVWSGIPEARQPLRDRAVALLPKITGQERIWLHWGMTLLAYPFFRDAAEVVGRLLALQDDFTTAQVQTRLVTTWGDRATSKVAAQKLLNTFTDWEVLRSTKAKGHFLLARKMTASIPELQLWLLEAMLAANRPPTRFQVLRLSNGEVRPQEFGAV
jgi:hypothetical protein